jgi:polyhydroxyalkanoate synthesis regulator phasin
MAKDDLLRRYQEAGTEFIEATLARAEDLFREVVRIGESAQKQAMERVEELRDAGRGSNEGLLETIRRELTNQMSQLSVATKADLARIEARIDDISGGRVSAVKKAPARRSAARKTTAKKTTARATTKSSAAKKSSASGSSTRKSTPRKSAAKKSGASKATGSSGSSS